jgi:hypothetical protein
MKKLKHLRKKFKNFYINVCQMNEKINKIFFYYSK